MPAGDTLWNSLRPIRWVDEIKLEEKVMYTSQFGYMDEQAMKRWMENYRSQWNDPSGDHLFENLKIGIEGDWDE